MNIEFIAEIGSNHNNSPGRMRKLIYAAADAGFNSVKFQYGLDGLFYRDNRALDFPEEWIHVILRSAHARGMEVGVSPCSDDAVQVWKGAADWWKIGSYELVNSPLYDIQVDGRVYLSTGMATYNEVIAALRKLHSKDVTLMDCVSQYPARVDGLKSLRDYPMLKNYKYGYSDHTVDEHEVMSIMQTEPVSTIELHFDLEGGGAEAGHSWTFPEAKELIRRVNPDWEERSWRRDFDGLRPMKYAREG